MQNSGRGSKFPTVGPALGLALRLCARPLLFEVSVPFRLWSCCPAAIGLSGTTRAAGRCSSKSGRPTLTAPIKSTVGRTSRCRTCRWAVVVAIACHHPTGNEIDADVCGLRVGLMLGSLQQQGVGAVAERDGGLVHQQILQEPYGQTWSSNGVLAQRWQPMQTRSTVDNHNVPTRRVGTMWSACEG